MTAAASRTLGPMLLPVLDILTILTVAFLATSGAFSLLSAADESHATAKQEVQQSQEEIEKLLRYLDVLKAERSRLRQEASRAGQGSALQQALAKLVAEIREIETRLSETERRLSRLREVTEILSKQVGELIEKVRAFGRVVLARNTEAGQTHALAAKEADLKARLGRLKRRLADLEARKASELEKASPPKLGVSLVRHRSVEREIIILLHEGRVYPDIGDFFSRHRSPGGMTTATPDDDGLTVEEALEEDSLLMKEVSTPGFAGVGRVILLVNPDSFAAYRVLRDKLVDLGVDYGWEPWQLGAEIVYSSREGQGRRGTSQGRAR